MEYKKGQIVTGCVTGIESYGVFVSLDDYYSGLIHISEISNGFVKNVNDYVKIGETVKVKILEVDDDNFHAKLSIKGINYTPNRKRFSRIEETPLGFTTLEKNLDNWINCKYEEIISKKSKKTN